MATDDDELLTFDQVGAELGGLSDTTAWRRFKAGELTAVNIGTARKPKLRVRRADLRAYIASRVVQPVPGRRRRAA